MGLNLSNINNFIFDMDGVITNTMPYHLKVWSKIFKDCGIDVTWKDIYKREGQKGIESVKEIFAEYGKPFSIRLGEQLLARKEQHLKKIVQVRFIPYSRNFLKHLHACSKRLALVTGTSRHAVLKILPKSIFELFDVVICGCDVQNGKPHPEPYLKALTKLKVFSNDTIAIENAPFGIRSAKRAGLKCLAVTTSLPKEYLKEADHIFASVKDLKNHIQLL